MHASMLVIVITGLSGSGKSTALRVFEDMGFFTVDGLPAALVPQFVTMFSQASLTDYKGGVISIWICGRARLPQNMKMRWKPCGPQVSPRLLFINEACGAHATLRLTPPPPFGKEGSAWNKP